MPGFAGVLGADPAGDQRNDVMLAALSRGEGDREGRHHLAQLSLRLGWIERDRSVSGVHVAWNAAADIGLWLYGESWVDGRAGAGRVIALYEQYGDAFVAKLDGWFCGVLVDLRRHCVLLFNDRFGVGRIHLAQTPDGLYFSTQARPLLRALPSCRRINQSALAETFAYGCVLRDRTIFDGITVLPGASLWCLTPAGDITRGTYFDRREWEHQDLLSDTSFDEELQATFRRVLPRYLEGPGVAMSLTGGLDGRMIMAWAGAAPGSLPCFSFVGPYRDCHDVRIAREVATACGQPHQVIRVGEQMLREFATLAKECVQISGGAMDVSGAVELYVNREARAIAPTRLTGNYGSEIVRGNVAFRPQRLPMSFYEPAFARHVDAAAALYAQERQTSALSFVAFKQVPWYHHARASIERSALDMRSPFLDNALVQLMYRASAAALRDKGPSLRLIHAGHPELARIPTDRGVRHGRTTWGDRMRQAVLDFSAKAEYAYDYGMPNRLSRVDRLLAAARPERLFLGRHKFYHFRIWYRRELADYLRDTLLSPTALARAPYREGVLEAMIESHVQGVENHTDEIHRALTHELIHQTLVDSSGNRGHA